MHYKNGRVAKSGDKVINLTTGRGGIIHSLIAGTSCNARLAPISDNDAYVTLKECLHLDDITTAEIPPAK